MTRVLVVDNYDSFTWNLVHLIGTFTRDIEVVRNDRTSVDAVLDERFDAVVLSPGPCTPDEAGICLPLIRAAAGAVPLFGVCLGLQSIGQAFGGKVIRAPLPIHGKVNLIEHENTGLFEGCGGPIEATRYHSLVVERETCPADLAVTAQTPDGLIMALSHVSLPVHGVQFHPESIMTQHGDTILGNFLKSAVAWNRRNDPTSSRVH